MPTLLGPGEEEGPGPKVSGPVGAGGPGGGPD